LTASSADARLFAQATYTGNTVVNSETLNICGGGGIPTTSAVSIASGAAVNLTSYYAPTGINRTIGGLTGAGVLFADSGTVTVNKTSGTDIFSGDIQGGQGLIKDGAGTLALSGANTYTGATAVNLGTLALVGGSQASPITVSSGSALGFTLGSPTTSSSTVIFSGATAKVSVTGTPFAATLMTATSITGTPVLDPAIPGFSLAIEDGATTLKLKSSGTTFAAGQSANSTTVAADFAVQHATPGFVQSANLWKTSVVSADNPAATMFFGPAITAGFGGMDAGVAYDVELTFLSDGSDRSVRITANGLDLEKQLALPNGEVLRKRWRLPAEILADGELMLEVSAISGPNAVLSGVVVFADNAKAKALVAPFVPPLTAEMIPSVRLTPRPATVAAVKATKVDLNGTWKFNPAPPAEFWKAPIGVDWKEIQVPGEWVMQGFTVQPNTAAGYSREFTLPPDWNGQRVKLRCDAVYSDATVWINGQKAGSHLGGFTPFELDVTKLLKSGAGNIITLAVKNESLADTLACGSKYAAHPLGGIPRKIYLFAVPELNLADLYVRTEFDREFANATLVAQVTLANDSANDSAPAKFELNLLDSSAKPLIADVPAIKAGQTFTTELRMPVASPRKWDAEHPNLYTVKASLYAANGTVAETVNKRIGFRQVEVRGNRLFVNNAPVKLRGICRHETHPLLGRATTPESCQQDVELIRAMNANLIRTAHYPPQEELIEACNEMGMFVELEAPYVWVPPTQARDVLKLPYFLRTQVETTLRDRSEPSVILWSLGNESFWGRNFGGALAVARKLDNSRPYLFDGSGPYLWAGSGINAQSSQPQPLVDIDVPHYPGIAGISPQFDANLRPLLIGEFAHLNCYNRRQFMTDPGLRDFWGEGIAVMWERMLASPSCIGGNVWAAIDDFFFLPSGDAVGYGNWGPLDGWRRSKPEYWHLKKIYSPVRITANTLSLPPAGKPAVIPVENRHFFSDLRELRFEWTCAGQSGTLANVAVAPGSKGELLVPLTGGDPGGKMLELKAFSPMGFMVDVWRFTVGTAKPTLPPAKSNPVTLIKSSETLAVQCGDALWAFDSKTGLIQQVTAGGKPVDVGGPTLMLLPIARWELDNPAGIQLAKTEYPPIKTACSGWQASKVESRETAEGVEIEIAGEYAEAKGRFLLQFTCDGRLTVDYDFKLKAPINPMQLGVVFDLPRSCDTLSWMRKAQWSHYPDDHIGRPEGTAKASTGKPKVNILGPHKQPDWSWSLDETEMGSNDFCSMKRNVLEASLRSSGGGGLRVIGGGTQHTRCWLDGERVRLLVADYANAGEGFCMSDTNIT
jgi:autotransporter-associated beta strand protein